MRILIALLFTISGIPLSAQHKCDSLMDKDRIGLNLDLDFFIAKLRRATFTTSQNKEEIPAFLMSSLDCITGGFSLGNDNEDYQCCYTSDKNLPGRKLLFAGKSQDILVMTYLTGGVGVSTHILLIQYADNKILKLWTTQVLLHLKTRNQILTYLRKHRQDDDGLNFYGSYL